MDGNMSGSDEPKQPLKFKSEINKTEISEYLQGGIYSCRGTRGNPVYYTDRSDDVTIEKTSQSRTLLIAGLLCGILLILLLLLLCYIKLLKDKSFIRTQRTNQSSAMKHRINQSEAQHSQNTSLQGDARIYESIGDYDDREKECGDFTYSLIELKNFTKKGESATEAADEGVYSEINPQTQGAFML
ncbi:uncharacterized protein LOC121813456 isoform X5 [Haplochromis burtoni]|uniref:uncharacterized protein LOC121813456 isoform X5 n=1 Tax=Haplochromis burtoni TaxID=8153 RepID=UPI001C2DA9A5|nr:uncharacterized protein LOC121813456 isoform X5 [Haplochromis burtoni]